MDGATTGRRGKGQADGLVAGREPLVLLRVEGLQAISLRWGIRIRSFSDIIKS